MDNKKTNETELTEKELTKKELIDEELEQVSGGIDKQKLAEILRQKNSSKDNN